MRSLSYAFTPFSIRGVKIPRPMLQVTLKRDNIEFPTALLLDSGADYSMLRTDIVEDYFLINISELEKIGDTSGIGGETKVAKLDVQVIFGYNDMILKENIPFQVPLDEGKNPPLSLIGRIPFFNRYRIDFRMGYTTDPSLGKFVIYPETHKRSADLFTPPMKIQR